MFLKNPLGAFLSLLHGGRLLRNKLSSSLLFLHKSVEGQRGHLYACLILWVVAFVFFLPGLGSLPVTDRDEARFAQATKQMLETKDFVNIRFQQEARNKKPVGIYWLQAAFVALGETLGLQDVRRTILFYRLPSFFGAVGSLLLSYWLSLAFVSRGGALLSAFLLGSTLLLSVEAHLAKTDAVLLVTILITMGALARLYVSSFPLLQRSQTLSSSPFPPFSYDLFFLFWGAIGVGLLIKGPFTPLVPALTALTLSFYHRSWRWLKALRPGKGLLLCGAIALPWFTLIMIQTQGAFLTDSVGQDLLSKIGSGQESHGMPPGTYFLLSFLTLWPLMPFFLLSFPFIKERWRTPPLLFLLAWIVPLWLLFELIPTKLPHYILPLVPALALLVTYVKEQGGIQFHTLGRKMIATLVPLVGMALGGGGAFLWFSFHLSVPLFFKISLLFIALMCCLVLKSIYQNRGSKILGQSLILCFLVTSTLYLFCFVPPLRNFFSLSQQVAEKIKEVEQESAQCSSFALATTSYREPSLVFLTRTDVHFLTFEQGVQFMEEAPCRLIVIDQDQQEAFLQAFYRAGSGHLSSSFLQGLGAVKGFNYNRNRFEHLEFYKREL